jgi:hypothetical protein
MKFTFGTDPEFVLYDKNRPVNAADILPNEPNAFKNIYHDNVMIEFKIPPAKEKDEAVEGIRDQFKVLHGIMGSRNLRWECTAFEDYTKEQRLKHNTINPNSGPEYCAYDLVMVKPPNKEEYRKRTERTAGGHIHVSASLLDVEHAFLARLMDLFVAVPAAYVNFDKGSSILRSHLWYGKPGRYRETEYGLEYRTLSNFWLASPDLVCLIYDLTDFTVQFYNDGGYYQLWSYDYDAPEPVHKCNAYNHIELTAALMSMSKGRLDRFWPLLTKYLPPSLLQKITSYSNKRHYDLYAEWKL